MKRETLKRLLIIVLVIVAIVLLAEAVEKISALINFIRWGIC